MIPDTLREQLPEDLQDAEIAGADTAAYDDHVRLYGPPGTGKSTQAALRTATRALEDDLLPNRMTVVTYRKALAGVVEQRLREWDVFDDPSHDDFDYWTTMHAAAQRASGFLDRVREDNPDAGMVGIQDEYDFCDRVGVRRKMGSPAKQSPWEVFKRLYDYAKSNLLDVGEYRFLESQSQRSRYVRNFKQSVPAERLMQDYQDKWNRPFREVVNAWEAFKFEEDIYDFYEQLEAALVSPTPPLDHLVIDEYHDATPLMAAVAERWIDRADTAIVAGDPDQVVNAYNGASPLFFERLPDRVDVPIPEVQLKTSYRVPDEHFAAAARVLNKERTAPTLSTAGPGQIISSEAGYWQYNNSQDAWTATPDPDAPGSPPWLVNKHGPDIMFLARTRWQLDGIATTLDRQGIIHQSQEGVGRDWDYLTTVMNTLALLEGRESPGSVALSAEQSRALFRHISRSDLSANPDRVDRIISDAERDREPIRLQQWASWVNDEFWNRYTRGQDSLKFLAKRRKLDDKDIGAMWRAWDRNDPPFEVTENVRVLTIHASKGAEAEDVVVYDGITNRVQAGMRASARMRENEARTWYVALTRASERLHIRRGGWNTTSYLPDNLEPQAAHAARKRRGESDV